MKTVAPSADPERLAIPPLVDRHSVPAFLDF
jgi:hypothetical protein